MDCSVAGWSGVIEEVLFGAEAGILSEGVAQVHDGMGNPLVLPAEPPLGLFVSLCSTMLAISLFRLIP